MEQEILILAARAREDRELEQLRATNLVLRVMLAQVREGLRHG